MIVFNKNSHYSLALFGDKKNDKDAVIRIAINEWAGYAPLVYAEVMGLYKKNNLPVEISFIANPSEINNLYKKRKFVGISTVLADAMSLKSEGVDGKVVLLTDYSMEGDAILADPKIKNIKDLKGKTIGINELNSFSHLLVLEAVKQAGLKEREINLKIVPFDKVTNELDAKGIVAGHTWDPEKKKALAKGYRAIFKATVVPGLISEGILFHEDFLLKNKENIKKLINIFYLAQVEMLKNPQESSEKMKSFFKNDPVIFAHSFSEMHFIDKKENLALMDSRNEKSVVLQFNKLINNFLEERGQASSSYLYKDVMTEDYLK